MLQHLIFAATPTFWQHQNCVAMQLFCCNTKTFLLCNTKSNPKACAFKLQFCFIELSTCIRFQNVAMLKTWLVLNILFQWLSQWLQIIFNGDTWPSGSSLRVKGCGCCIHNYQVLNTTETKTSTGLEHEECLTNGNSNLNSFFLFRWYT